ncbi:MAG: hypothetical protein KDI39_18760, partial [Pseudomonadales bacterium]|nr:hypothetical protein [Pseudomonadales bacterium]
NLLRLSYEKILLLRAVIFRDDYHGIQSELKGRKLAHFNIEYTVYQKTQSSTVFRDFKDSFTHALANLVLE